MCETISIDARTILVKSDSEKELSEIIDFVTKKSKEKAMKSFLAFASSKRKKTENYKFDREECYAK